MKKINTLLFYLNNPKYWHITYVICRFFLKLKDYDRLESDYSFILDHVTLGKMSKTNYDKETIIKVIDHSQSELHYNIIKDDLIDIIKNNGNIDDIKTYINQL